MTRRIRFLTDSTCDIPPDVAEQWGITVVPAFVNSGDYSLPDYGGGVSREEFYHALPTIRPHPSTAAPPVTLAQEYIDRAFEGADHLVMVTASVKLTSIYNSVRLGAQHLPAERYTLLDSRSLSMGLGWQVLAGAQTAARTGDLAATLDAMRSTQTRTYLYALLEGVEFLRRGGRVSWAPAMVGTMLRLRPLIALSQGGEVVAAGRERTMVRGYARLEAYVRDAAPVERLAFLHANNPSAVAALRDRLRDVLPDEQHMLTTLVTPTIGTHTGPHAVGVALVSRS